MAAYRDVCKDMQKETKQLKIISFFIKSSVSPYTAKVFVIWSKWRLPASITNYRYHNFFVSCSFPGSIYLWSLNFAHCTFTICGARGGLVVKALRYKPAGRGFDSRWCQDFSTWYNPAGCTMALGSTQPLTEMSTRCVPCHQECSWGLRRPVCMADNLPPLQCRCHEN